MVKESSSKSIGFQKDLEYIKEKVDVIEARLEKNYVTKEELMLVKQECYSKIDGYDTARKLIYGIVGLILTSVVGALISLIVK